MTLSAPLRRQFCRIARLRGDELSPRVSVLRAAQPCRGQSVTVLEQGKQARFPWLRAAVAGALLLGFSLPAAASLGGNVSSVEADRVQMRASLQVTQHPAYDVHEIRAPGGTVVDEFVSPEGTVFAVTWHGQFPPPMQQILGSCFQQYAAALRAQPQTYGHRPLNIQEPGLVVQTGGHMRAYLGRAYIPALLPQDVTASQIQ
jgi:hypothetical protein